MMRKVKVLLVGMATVAALAVPTAAFADSCANVSRPEPTGNQPTQTGNWVWLPSIGVPVDAWGFAPPGSPDSQLLGAPGANGNYTNGKTSSLLGVSNNCPPGNNTNRQTSQGIQSGCE